MAERPVTVHLLPSLIPEGALAGGVAVVADILRATTTIVHALAAGCTAVYPCLDIESTARTAAMLPNAIRGGERGGTRIDGHQIGNSPLECTPELCYGRPLVTTTTNGTQALIAALPAQRVFAGAFVNFSATCDALLKDDRPVHLVCAGSDGEVSLEDTLFAGAVVEVMSAQVDVKLNDAARLAWDAFENHGRALAGALQVGRGGESLRRLGYDADIAAAARVDAFALAAELLRRDPPRLEVGSAGVTRSHWPFAADRSLP